MVARASGSFRHELEHTSHVPHVILIELLVEVIATRLGEHARSARWTVLTILSDVSGHFRALPTANTALSPLRLR